MRTQHTQATILAMIRHAMADTDHEEGCESCTAYDLCPATPGERGNSPANWQMGTRTRGCRNENDPDYKCRHRLNMVVRRLQDQYDVQWA